MYLRFAWRYFKAKKSANAINIIAWVTTGVIAFATCCQILVLSVFNGFEDIVKSLYSSFYADMKVSPTAGKTFFIDGAKIKALQGISNVQHISFIVEEKALLKNDELQSIVQLKGVDTNYPAICDISSKIINGKYDIGDSENARIVLGAGIEEATGITLNEAFAPEKMVAILPKSNVINNDPLETLSEGVITASGTFSIQQEFDNSYAITNIDFVKQQIGLQKNEFTNIEIKLKNESIENNTKLEIEKLLGSNFIVKNKYEQNENLYNTMKIEKWAIYALLCLILIIAAFNMISSLTMLVLEKKHDISILQSMGANKNAIKNIFLIEGLLLGSIGTFIGVTLASLICLLQVRFKLIKLEGGSFLIDYFPVKIMVTDFMLVTFTAMIITLLASWFPSHKAANQALELK